MATEERVRICPLCEATCGLKVTVEDGVPTSVRGNPDDAFSEGYICPKGAAIIDLHNDPDHLHAPQLREGDTWRDGTWDEAIAEVEAKLLPIVEKYGRDSVGIYLGNPGVHNISLLLYGQVLIRAIGTKNIFSASTVDQVPKQLVSALMFGTGLSVPIPDLDRTDYLLVVGANPMESNGSLMTAPNIPARLKRIRERGGKIVVIDPRYTKTAAVADAHHAIRPGTDALLFLAMANVIVEEGLTKVGALEEHLSGLDEAIAVAKAYPPERVADVCGIDAETIRGLAREFAAQDKAVIHARIGTCTQQFGSLASWAVELVHILTGNLDQPGGALFTNPAHGAGNAKGKPGVGRGVRMGRRKSRVTEHPELFGEFPVALLAEEIETPGEGQIKALITVAGNPVLSTPNSDRLEKALGSLEYMVSLDIYRNETTRHADVIFPGLSHLATQHYDLAFSQLAIANHARYSPPVVDKPEGTLDEWETILRLAGLFWGMGGQAPVEPLDEMTVRTLIQRETGSEYSPIHERDEDEILAALGERVGPARIIDLMLRTGPYGEGFGANPDGLTLAKLEAAPDGIAIGPLESRVPEVLRTSTGMIEVAPDVLLNDVRRLEAFLEEGVQGGLALVGRRHLRSNNSWMHNVKRLVSGNNRCTLHIHPSDARERGLSDGEVARVTSRVGELEVAVEYMEDIMPGVVSLPHGWGHDVDGMVMDVAREHAGVNTNILTDEAALDVPSGNAVLCGIPVEVAKVEAAVAK